MAAEYTTVAAVWDSIAVQVGRLDRGRHAEFPICKVQVLSNASALSDARFGVEVCTMLFARSIKPFERGRWRFGGRGLVAMGIQSFLSVRL